jgi:DNA recombination protein RmuC
MADRFKTLANEIFDAKSKTIVEQNQSSLGHLLQPLRIELESFRKKVDDVYVKEAEGRSALLGEITSLKEASGRMQQETTNLTLALKGDTKQQGDWGEMVLTKLLEDVGLQSPGQFVVQESLRNDDGALLRPDVVIKLPADRHVIVDSKVSLTAYTTLASATDKDTEARALKEHLDSLKRHIAGLSVKGYERLYDGRSPDFVLLFVPIEGALMAALRADPSLTQYAWQRKVMLVSANTLMLVVRCIGELWTQEARVQNVQEIADRGAKLYDKFVGFVEALDGVGAALGKAQASYSDAAARLHTGSGNLVRQAEMLRELGVKPKRELAVGLVERAAGED